VIAGRNIICIASNWAYDPTSKHHVMKLLAERNHVIWVNYHASRRPALSGADLRAATGKLRQIIDGPRRVAENITVITPLVIPLPGSRVSTALNRQLLVRQIKRVLKDLPPRPVQLWTFAPDVDYLAGRFVEEALVYYCVDDFSEFTGYDRDATRAAESRLCERTDLIVTTSQALHDSKRDLAHKTVLVTHGVDASHFATASHATIPSDLADIPRPRLGFWGMIQDWIDLNLLGDVASARPDWSIVLIGEALVDTSPIRGLPNVHLLGRKSYAALPAYAAGLDAGLIPFKQNALTRAVNPIKLREYLAAGLPVVSTPMPEVARYSQWVRIADSADTWIRAIKDALCNETDAIRRARQEAMACETWAMKLLEIESHIDRIMRARTPRRVSDPPIIEPCGAI